MSTKKIQPDDSVFKKAKRYRNCDFICSTRQDPSCSSDVLLCNRRTASTVNCIDEKVNEYAHKTDWEIGVKKINLLTSHAIEIDGLEIEIAKL